MLASLGLGWRLATRGTAHGRVRAALAVVVAALGTAALLSVLVVVAAVRGGLVPGRDQGPDPLGTVLAGGSLLAVALPVLLAAFTAGRMSAALRARRLARLRLLGMTARQLGLVGVAESAPWALLGWVLGVGGHLVLLPVLARLEIGARSYAVADLVPSLAFLLVSASVPATLVAGALGGARTPSAALVSQARTLVVRRPGLWRLLPLALGLALLGLGTRTTWRDGTVDVVLFLGGAALAVVGAVLVPPLVVRLVADLLVGLDRPAATVAGRRLQAQPGALTRVLSGLVVGLVVATAAQGLVADVQRLPQYQGVLHNQQVESTVGARVPAGMTPQEFRERLDQVGGIRQTGLVLSATTPGRVPDPLTGDLLPVEVVVSTCADLAVVQPRLRGCRDDTAAWIQDPAQAVREPFGGLVPLIVPPDYAADPDAEPGPPVAEVEVSGEAMALSPREHTFGGYELFGSIFVPRALLTEDELAQLSANGARATVVADPRPDLAGELESVGIAALAPWDLASFERLQRYVDTIRLLTVVVLGLGLAGFVLGLVDRVLERRGELARLRLLGTPVSVLRAAHWLEAAVPLVLGCTLALALGTGVALGYLEFVDAGRGPDEQSRLEPTFLLGVAGLAVAGCAAVALVTSVGLGSRLRPDLVRQP